MSWVMGQGPNYLVHFLERHSFPHLEFRTDLWSLGVLPDINSSSYTQAHLLDFPFSWLRFILGSPRLSLVAVVVVVRVEDQTQAFSPGSTALPRVVHLPCPQTPRCLEHELCSGLNSRHCDHALSHTPSLLGKLVPSIVPLCVLVHPLNGHMGQVLAALQRRELHQHNLFCFLLTLEKQFKDVVRTGRTEGNGKETDLLWNNLLHLWQTSH